MIELSQARRRVRGDVRVARRQSRMTSGQRRALQTHWRLYGVDFYSNEHDANTMYGTSEDFGYAHDNAYNIAGHGDGGDGDNDAHLQRAGGDNDARHNRMLNWREIFGRHAPLAVEIGFGNGDALLQFTRARADWNALGIEVHRPSIGALLVKLAHAPQANVRIVHAEAMDVLQRIPLGSVDLLLLFFPDPWPKKRHHKRRLVTPTFATLCAERLRAGGVLHATTDWAEYAEQMMTIFSACHALANAAGAGRYGEPPAWRGVTRFEQRGLALGHRCFDLRFVRGP